jgi:hypothetical protein
MQALSLLCVVLALALTVSATAKGTIPLDSLTFDKVRTICILHLATSDIFLTLVYFFLLLPNSYSVDCGWISDRACEVR